MSFCYVVCGKSGLKGKAVKYVQSGDITPLVINIGTRCIIVVKFTHRLLYTSRKNSQPPLSRRVSKSHRRYASFQEENFFLLPEMEPCFLCCPDRSLFIIVPKSQLHDPCWPPYLYYWLLSLFGYLKFPEIEEVSNRHLTKHCNLRKLACSRLVQSFKYLGSTVNQINTIEEGIKGRLIAGKKFPIQTKKMLQCKLLSRKS
jgi:hypothetical protein